MRTLLIANRGEIALRIQATAKRLGLRTVAVYSDADRDARHAREADAAIRIGGPAPRDSYLSIDAIVAAAKRSGADAVHPGYGFLAESADFADAVVAAGLVWVGPSPASIRAMGDKAEAKRLVRAAGVPTLPGIEDVPDDPAALAATVAGIGFPVMVKAAAGGGGRGMRRVAGAADLDAAIAQARSEAEHAFGDGRVLVERALEGARHIEVQVFGDGRGEVLHLGERDCSVQRRHQKLIEETPSPAVDAALRERLGAAATAAARAVRYVGAGTVEFLLDQGGRFYFMEMNTRLQVEHPVTELVTGLDLVEWQLRIAMGEPLPLKQDEIRCDGHAIEARLCAEDPAHDFLPQSGRLALWLPDPGTRIDHALATGAEIPPFYDSMIAKVCAHGPTREVARERLARALDATVALGLPTNKAFLAAVLRDPEFAVHGATTDFLARRLAALQPPAAEAETLAIAAVLMAAAADFGEWTAWSNNPARVMRLKFGPHDVALRFGSGTYRAEIGDREIALALVSFAPPRARVSFADGADETVAFVVDGDSVHLARGGGSWRFDNVVHQPSARRGAGAAHDRILAPMNGRVVAVDAAPGDLVEAGRAVIVLEAMKMEHALAAPVAARITAVHVAPGAQVAPGHVLVELAPVGPGSEAA